MLRYIFYFINIFLCPFLYSQNEFDTLSKIYIDRLEQGSLLVRLESMDKKIQYLKNQIDNPKCDQKCKTKHQHLLNTTLSERDTFNIKFINTFQSYFNFCPVYFYYDKDHEKLFKSHLNYPFINSSLNPISIDSIYADKILILAKDHTPGSANEGWVLRTSMGATLQNSMPFIIETNYNTLWNRIIYKDPLQRNLDYMVKKFNNSLHELKYEVKLQNLKAAN